MTATATKTRDPELITFVYKARTHEGRIARGTMKHRSRAVVLAALTADPKFQSVLEVKATGSSATESRARPKQKNLVAFARQLAIYLQVGLSVKEALLDIQDGDDIGDLVLDKAIKRLYVLVDSDGLDLADAMAQMPYVFPRLMVETIRTGINTGKLPEHVVRVADDLEAGAEQAAKVRKALTYPVVVLVVSIAIFIFLMTFIVPRFAGMYESMSNGEVQLPALTRMVIGISENMVWAAPLGIIITIAITIWYRLNSQEEKVQRTVDRWKVNMPIFGTMFRNMALIRFCRNMSALMRNDIRDIEALRSTADAIGNTQMREAILKAAHNIDHGIDGSIADALSAEPLFPKFLLKFVDVGQKSSKMDEALEPVGKYYSREVDQATNNMSALIEPIFMLILAGMLAVVALAIYLPYFNIGDLFAV